MISVDINTAFADGLLRDLDRALTDMSPVYDEIGELLLGSTKERFREGVSPEGIAWPQKQMSTILATARREGHKTADSRPLFGPSGDLYRQISWALTGDGVEWGTSPIYAAVQQFGAKKGQFGTAKNGSPTPWGDIPARPFIGLSQEDETGIVEILTEWLQRAVDK